MTVKKGLAISKRSRTTFVQHIINIWMAGSFLKKLDVRELVQCLGRGDAEKFL